MRDAPRDALLADIAPENLRGASYGLRQSLDTVGAFLGPLIGIAALIAADLLLSAAGSLAAVAVAVALWGLHLGLTQGILSTLVADTAPPELRGTGFSLFNLLVGLAQLASSIVAGVLWDVAGARFTFLAAALFAALTLSGLALTRRIAPALR